jgi:hypothetical protein
MRDDGKAIKRVYLKTTPSDFADGNRRAQSAISIDGEASLRVFNLADIAAALEEHQASPESM